MPAKMPVKIPSKTPSAMKLWMTQMTNPIMPTTAYVAPK